MKMTQIHANMLKHTTSLIGGLLFLGVLAGISLETTADAAVLRGHITQEAPLESPEANQPGVIGVSFDIRPGTSPAIAEVYPGTPAAKAGLHPGDEVVAINQGATRGLTLHQVDQAISDVPGDKVTFLVSRQGRIFPVNLIVESLENIRSAQTRSMYNFMAP